MTKRLEVGYLSQWGPDALEARDDCGPACVAMTLNYLGIPCTVNKVWEKTGAGPSSLIGFTQLVNTANAFKCPYGYKTGSNLADLKKFIDNGQPLTVLINYGRIPQSYKQDTYAGPHFVLVDGYDDNGVFVKDPDWWDSRIEEGARVYYPNDVFLNAWSNCYEQGKNPNCSFLYPLTGKVVDSVVNSGVENDKGGDETVDLKQLGDLLLTPAGLSLIDKLLNETDFEDGGSFYKRDKKALTDKIDQCKQSVGEVANNLKTLQSQPKTEVVAPAETPSVPETPVVEPTPTQQPLPNVLDIPDTLNKLDKNDAPLFQAIIDWLFAKLGISSK